MSDNIECGVKSATARLANHHSQRLRWSQVQQKLRVSPKVYGGSPVDYWVLLPIKYVVRHQLVNKLKPYENRPY